MKCAKHEHPSPTPHYTGLVDNDVLKLRMKLRGVSREVAIAEAVTAGVRDMRRRYPDLRTARIVVDVTDKPGAFSVTWHMHTGDHVPSLLVSTWTTRHDAAHWLTVAAVK